MATAIVTDLPTILAQSALMASALSPIVMGIVQAIKATEYVKGNLMPLVSYVVGLGFGVLLWLLFGDPMHLFTGLLAGGGAIGVYETAKSVTTKADNVEMTANEVTVTDTTPPPAYDTDVDDDFSNLPHNETTNSGTPPVL